MKQTFKVDDLVKHRQMDFHGKIIFRYIRHEDWWSLVKWNDDDIFPVPDVLLRRFTPGFKYPIGAILIGENNFEYEIVDQVVVQGDKFNIAEYIVTENNINLLKQRLIHEDDLDLYIVEKDSL